MSVPAMRELRRIFPDAHITLHTRTWADGLFRDVDFIDELVTFDKHRWKVKDVYDNSQFLKEDGYDLVVLLPNSFESAITSFLSRIPRRIGYNKDVRGLLLTDPIPVPEWKNRRHEVFYYLNLIAEVERRVLGRETIGSIEPDIRLDISHERQARALAFLRDSGIDPLRRTVALGVGSTNSIAKRWPAEYYAILSDFIQLQLGLNVILIGSEEDSKVAASVAAAAETKPIDLTGRTDLGEAAALLSVIDLLISNDMGLAHVAPAVGTNTIAIFGPTNPETTRPFSSRAEIIRQQVECSPCMLRECPIDHRCMRWITAEDIYRRAYAILNAQDDIGQDFTNEKRINATTID